MVAEERAVYLPDRKTWSPHDKRLIFREHHFGPGAFLTLLLTTLPKKQQIMASYTGGILRLEDTRRYGSDPVGKEHFQSAWHVFYHWFNVLQWLPTFRFITGQSLSAHSDEWAFLEQMLPFDDKLKALTQTSVAKDPDKSAPEVDLKWAEYVHSSYRSVAVGLVKAGVPKPEVGYEFMDGDRVVGEAELAWPDHRLCILRKHQRDDEPAIRKLGWKVWDLSPYENDKGEPVKPEGADWKELWRRALERGM